MAKMTDTTRTILTIIVALLVIAGAVTTWATTRTVKAQVDSTQDERIGKVEDKAEENEDELSNIKEKAAEELATKRAIFDTMSRMEMVQQTLSTDVGSMKVDVAITKTKVENLEAVR